MGETDWLRGKLDFILIGRVMLSKSLIQFSIEGWGCVSSLFFDLRPNYGGGNEDNVDILQKVPCRHCYTQCPQPCSKPPPTHSSARDSWTLMGKSGSISCWQPSEHFWRVWHLVLNMILPLLPSSWGYSFAPGHGIYPQSCSITRQPPLQHLQSCWGFSALGCGVSPHSRSSTVQLLLQPRVAESYVTKFRQLRTLWGVLKNYYFYYFSKSNKFSLVKKGTESAV